MAKRPPKSADSGDGKPVDRRGGARERARQAAAAEKRRRRFTQILVIVIVGVVAIGIVASAVFFGRRDQQSRIPTGSGTTTVSGTSVPLAIVDDGVQVGDDSAKAKLDLWVDYSCPVCKQFEDQNTDTIGQYIVDKKVQVTYHNIQIVTAFGSRAGSAGACIAANQPENWWAFNTAVYANQPAESTDGSDVDINALAQQAGVTDEAALSCIDDETYKPWITSNTQASAEAGVTGTPTLFFNGTKSDTILSGTELTAKLDELQQS